MANNNWTDWQKNVMSRLDNIDEHVGKAREDIAALKVRAALAGGGAGGLVVIVAQLVEAFQAG